ncbi:DUF4105 domain-containing protein [Allohahella marinimesophila]|uniref:Lnb N-terminal periplasmic domain-containing protein n=1 Tax=Allohahella marinimesophila TaxID=1054972 RepID=UPI0031E377E6
MSTALFLTASLSVSASETADTLTPISPAELTQLSTESTWLHLLHYHRAGLLSTFSSQVDDDRFFLSPNGATDPEAEMLATIAAFQRGVSGNNADDSAQCRFPARFHWLSERLPALEPLRLDCAAFHAWSQRIGGKGLSLVFPAAFINSPSSMFGHTLIRIDRGEGSNPLLDYAVNYAANANAADDPLLFSIKGLAGGYPGIVSIVPYYEKVKEYHFLESRNVWEYELKVTQAEVDQFVRHVWEVQHAEMDYFFFTENCSYQLLALLDASSDRFDFTDEFLVRAIPGDTVRILVENGVVGDTAFRPSAATQLAAETGQLDQQQVAAVRDYVEVSEESPSDWLDTLRQAGLNSDDDSSRILLDTAYRYARFLAAKKKVNIPGLGRKTVQLLSARSKLGPASAAPLVDRPAVRDDEGHETLRLEASAGVDADEPFLEFGVRPAFHDLLDPMGGYPVGASLEMFRLRLRQALSEDAKLRVHDLTLIDIDSRAVVTQLDRPLSWGVAAGFNRESTYEPFAPYLQPSVGLTYALGDQPSLAGSGDPLSGWLFTARVNGSLRLHADIESGFALASGPELALLRQSDQFSVSLVAAQYFRVAGRKTDPSAVDITGALHFNRSLQLRLSTGYEDDSAAQGWGGRAGFYVAF